MGLQFNPSLSHWAREGVFRNVIAPPLEAVTGAAAAYGLRRLRYAYAGSAIRVRRSSDNAEADIGFTTNGDLDLAALLAHCGAGSGYVVTWYDQSGNGRDAAQATAANQPRIVSSGVVDTQNGKPSILFDGSNDLLSLSGAGLSIAKNVAGFSALIVTQSTNTGATQYPYGIIAGTASGTPRHGIQKTNLNTHQAVSKALDGDSGGFTSSTPDNQLLNVLANVTNYNAPLVTFYRNGTSIGSTASGITAGNTSNTDSLSIMIGTRRSADAPWNGYVAEVLMYAATLSTTNRQTIERNQGTYYGVTVA